MPVQVTRPKKVEGAGQPAPFIHLPQREGAVDEWIKKAKGEKQTPSQRRDTMKVKMKVTKRASENGITNREYLEGQEYDLAPALAESLIAKGAAEAVGIETKMAAAPENKMEKKPENKTKRGRHLK
jgi:hypothetical protein